DKLVEDTVMIVFRKTKPDENIVLNACKTALLIKERLKRELPDFSINVGIASGEAVSGKIGSRKGKLDYTVIGYAVNLAARLKLLAYKAKNTGILLCPNSIRQIHGACRLNFIERINVKGINNRSFPLYELVEIRDD
ncbi:MAG: adenylate/guanylate cyclase domain-containing protein, partial [Candidatus Riflebacteria bacterium]|nr:adenylate/guanylate cyclase domain-containing protein [Candidatus Riflebacteria bacterium]